MQQKVGADFCDRVVPYVKPVNFRPSPNFKNMKKYLKQRTDSVQDASGTESSPERTPKCENVHPPLPLDPPPDDAPLIKYHCSPVQEFDGKLQPKQERVTPELDIKYEDTMEEDKESNVKPICKDFIRGNCSRVGCKFRHEVDLSQLRGIFIFCHNYQNDVCNKPNCKYVHADVFEEQKFYRTGELPKVLKQKPQPPQPPLPPPEEDKNKDPIPVFSASKPPPTLVPKPDSQLLGVFSAALNMEPQSPKAPNSRPWSDGEEGLSEMFSCTSPQEKQNDGKCPSCKVMENRLKFAVDRLKEVMTSAAESEVRMLKLERKHKFLLQMAATITSSARAQDRDNMANRQSGSIFSQIDLQQALQQSTAMTDTLQMLKDDPKRQANSLVAQLKNLASYSKLSADDALKASYHLPPPQQQHFNTEHAPPGSSRMMNGW